MSSWQEAGKEHCSHPGACRPHPGPQKLAHHAVNFSTPERSIETRVDSSKRLNNCSLANSIGPTMADRISGPAHRNHESVSASHWCHRHYRVRHFRVFVLAEQRHADHRSDGQHTEGPTRLINGARIASTTEVAWGRLAKGRSPLVAALVMLLATRMLTGREELGSTEGPFTRPKRNSMNWSRNSGTGIRGHHQIVDWHRHEKHISPGQLHQALGPETVKDLSQSAGMPQDDLLTHLSRLLPDVIDRLTPKGQLPPARDLAER